MTEIDLKTIISSEDVSRESTPKLQGLGFGIVTPVEGSDKPSLFTMALGGYDLKDIFCSIVETHDDALVNLAGSIDLHSQLQPCRVRRVKGGKYILTFGARRCLAILYNHAKFNKPAKVWATVCEGDERQALIESATENGYRLPPSYIDQARLFQRLRDQGMSVQEIAKVYPMGKATTQTIYNRLELLKLPLDMQLMVHHKKLSQDAALKMLRENDDLGQTPSTPNGVAHKPANAHTLQSPAHISHEGPQKPQEEQPSEKQDETTDLRRVLEEFIGRLEAVSSDVPSPSTDKELLELTAKARRLLVEFEKKMAGDHMALAG